jgi:uncharacterized protein involved in propanediol utilization
LPKPGFDALLELVESAGLYGLNVAHSGSVVGLLLDRRRHDVDFAMAAGRARHRRPLAAAASAGDGAGGVTLQ